MADRRFALINKDISSDQIEDALNEDLTITGDWLFEGNVEVDGTFTIATGLVTSGLYTPTLTNTTNVAASTPFESQWMRVGGVVTVSGQVNIDPTTASIATVMLMSLPTAASFTLTGELAGTALSSNGVDMASVRGATATGEARFDLIPSTNGNVGYFFHFTYAI